MRGVVECSSPAGVLRELESAGLVRVATVVVLTADLVPTVALLVRILDKVPAHVLLLYQGCIVKCTLDVPRTHVHPIDHNTESLNAVLALPHHILPPFHRTPDPWGPEF